MPHNVIQSYVNRTSIHGVPDAYSDKHWFWRCFWAVLIVLALVMAVIGIVGVLSDYNKGTVLTNQFEKTNSTMDFPVLKLCLTSSINDTRRAELGLMQGISSAYVAVWRDRRDSLPLLSNREDIQRAEVTDGESNFMYVGAIPSHMDMLSQCANRSCALDFQQKLLSTPATPEQLASFDYNDMFFLLKKLRFARGLSVPSEEEHDYWAEHYQNLKPFLIDNKLNFDMVSKALAMDWTKVVIACRFNKLKTDCESLIETDYDIVYGQCMKVNVGQQQVAENKGLSLYIHLNSHHAQADTPAAGGGIAFAVMEKYVPTRSDYTLVPAATAAFATISMTEYDLTVSRDTAKCHDYYEFTHFNSSYSVESCRSDVEMKDAENQCGCILPMPVEYLKNLSTVVCTDVLAIECFTNTIKLVPPTHCLPECQYRDYKIEATYKNFPSNALKNKVFKVHRESDHPLRMSEEQLQRWAVDMVILNIAFPELQYTVVEQSLAYSVDALIGSVGGYLGLYLGISLISLAQLAIFSIEAFFRKIFCYND